MHTRQLDPYLRSGGDPLIAQAEKARDDKSAKTATNSKPHDGHVVAAK